MAPEISLQEWQRGIRQLAYDFLVITPCKKCGYPVNRGYCCGKCGDTNPSEPPTNGH